VAFFVDNGLILAKRAATLASSEAEFTGIPSSVDRIYIIGYPLAASTSPDVSSVSEYTSVTASLLTQMIEISEQNAEDATEVNTFGYADVDLHDVAAGGTKEVTVKVAPAVSRIEIAKIDPVNRSPLVVKKSIDRFDLNAIYINNTYTQLGLDSITKPTSPSSILNFGGTDIGSTSKWGNPAAQGYPSGFFDVVNRTGASSYEPTVTTEHWGYYVVPLSDDVAGTTINENVQTAVPHIILKVSNIKPNGSLNIIEGPMFLTVKQYKNASTDAPITQFERGKVYVIDNLAFGVEHLSPLPEATPSAYTLTLTVQGWENKLIEQGVQ
jgi:hypothetical protein